MYLNGKVHQRLMNENGIEICEEVLPPDNSFPKEKSQNKGCKSNTHLWQIGKDLKSACDQFNNYSVQSIALGCKHCLVLTHDPNIYSYGENNFGQLGLGHKSPSNEVNLLHQFKGIKIKKVSCGARHSAVLCDDGSVFCWGDSSEGQCGLNDKGIITAPTHVIFPSVRKLTEDNCCGDTSLTFIIDIACGELFTVAIDKKGLVWTWGSQYGLGHGKDFKECLGPKLVTSISDRKATQVVCGLFHCLVLTENYYEDTKSSISAQLQRTSSIVKTTTKSKRRTSQVPSSKSTFYLDDQDDNSSASSSLISKEVEVEQIVHLPSSSYHVISSQQMGRSAIGKASFFEKSSAVEVWSWGKGDKGQLGHNDKSDRYEPECVLKLQGISVSRLCAGCYHSVAITTDSQIYCWGDNTSSQLGFKTNPITVPLKLNIFGDARIWDVACGNDFTLFLGDVDRNSSKVYFCGQVESSNVSEYFSKPLSNTQSDSLKMKIRNSLSKSARRKNEDETPITGSFVHVIVRELVHFEQREYILCLSANYDRFACLTSRNDSAFEALYQFSRAERLFYQQLKIIQKSLIEPLLETDEWKAMRKMKVGDNLYIVLESFNDLMHGISQELKHLTIILKSALAANELFSYLFSDSFRALFDRYSKSYAKVISIDGFKQCEILASNIIKKSEGLKSQQFIKESSFESLMNIPLMRSNAYREISNTMVPFFINTPEENILKDVVERWSDFYAWNKSRLITATGHNKIWIGIDSKLADALKHPDRKIKMSSEDVPLYYFESNRKFSDHTFYLCNDVFVHMQSRNVIRQFALVTLWVDSEKDTEVKINPIRLTSPEEVFVLCAEDSNGKDTWMTEINRAITKCLPSNTQNIQSTDNTTDISSLVATRQAKYTFSNTHPKYKGATYNGTWFKANPHGMGKMEWPDKSFFEGKFKDGLFHGPGQMVWTEFKGEVNALHGGQTSKKVYSGTWLFGNKNGYGTMIYDNGEEYKGLFRDNLRHGHGVLTSFMGNNSIHAEYVGNWVADIKTGYGVIDYVSGEKYMGIWSEDQRHGHGVVFTTSGILYEGEFANNKFVGEGLLLDIDNTKFEGDFIDDLILNGRGVFTFPNGDYFTGSFKGKWGDDIDMNGKFSKKKESLHQRHVTKDIINAGFKCQSLFNECYRILGRTGNRNPEPMEAWIRITAEIQASQGKSDIENLDDNNYEDIISLGMNINDLQTYLSENVLSTAGHPLKTLIDGLVHIFCFTYISPHVHHRLILHAVAELKSYVYRLYELLSVLFPDLCTNVNEERDKSIPLLHPLLLPYIYKTLFTLFSIYTKDKDYVYMKKLKNLNKMNDTDLLSFFDVERRDMILSGECSFFKSSVETFRQITHVCSPMDKIEVIRKTTIQIQEDVTIENGATEYLGMDRLLPIFHFVVVRAKVSHLGAELQFIEDIIEESMLLGEYGHNLTTLRGCYTYIVDECDPDTVPLVKNV